VKNPAVSLIWHLMVCLLVLGGGSRSADAALWVTVLDSTVGLTGEGRANVLISSDSASDQLAGFVVRLDIGTTSRILEFLDLGGGVPVDSHLSSPSYVFAPTGSAARDTPPAGSIGPGTSYLGVDASNDPQGVSGLFTDRLLTTLHFTGATSAPPLVGDVFPLSLNPVNSFFLDPDGQEIPFTITQQGTVLVVPEPQAWLLAVLALWPVVRQGLRPRRHPGTCGRQ
jgi:hypothetical protein